MGWRISQQRTDYNLYEGWELVGYPEKVFLRGNLIVDGEQWLGHSGQGRFLSARKGKCCRGFLTVLSRQPRIAATLLGVGSKVFWAYPTVVVQDFSSLIALYASPISSFNLG